MIYLIYKNDPHTSYEKVIVILVCMNDSTSSINMIDIIGLHKHPPWAWLKYTWSARLIHILSSLSWMKLLLSSRASIVAAIEEKLKKNPVNRTTRFSLKPVERRIKMYIICHFDAPTWKQYNYWVVHENFKISFYFYIYQDLNYVGILAGRPGAWLVKKICFICMQSQNFKKNLILKFKTISRRCFIFMIALTVYE